MNSRCLIIGSGPVHAYYPVAGHTDYVLQLVVSGQHDASSTPAQQDTRVVLSGSTDGTVRAVSPNTSNELWGFQAFSRFARALES